MKKNKLQALMRIVISIFLAVLVSFTSLVLSNYQPHGSRSGQSDRLVEPDINAKNPINNEKLCNSALLGLDEFYNWRIYLSDSKISPQEVSEVNPYVDPQMGWKTGGKPVPSPTKVATEGLSMVLTGNVEGAKKRADWLLKNSITKNGALFFPFQFDFSPYWPYSLKAPWSSALTQGLSLGLFSYLYKTTGDESYKKTADQIYGSFLIPIEDGGFTRYEKEGPFFEEYPAEVPIRVLNGAAVTMLALHDYAVITKNNEAQKMFLQSVVRLGALLPQYEFYDPGSKLLLSSYSLAPVRPEVLGRFIGDGNASIFSMTLLGIKQGKEHVLSTVRVGEQGDDDTQRLFYVWPDKAYMNWSDPLVLNGENTRQVNAEKGQYNHSPFKFAFPLAGSYDSYQIEIEYNPLKNGPIDVQLFDENEYWSVGKIGDGNIQSYLPAGGVLHHPIYALKSCIEWILDKLTGKNFHANVTKRFTISQAFIKSWRSRQVTQPPADVKYLDDNQILIDIIGRISGSGIFDTYASRWKDSALLVPARWFNQAARISPLLVGVSPTPTLGITSGGDQEQKFEHPSVIKIDGEYMMFYNDYKKDNASRLLIAVSNDGMHWIQRGQLSIKNLPAAFTDHLAFSSVLKNEVASDLNKKYLMYFSEEPKNNSFEKPCWAFSPDGWHWSFGGYVNSDSNVTPFVTRRPDGTFIMFYSTFRDGKYMIKSSLSKDGMTWPTPWTVYVENSPLRELSSITGVYLNGKLALLVESEIKTDNGRHETLLFTDKDGNIVECSNNPVVVDHDWEAAWDNIKNNYDIIEDNGQYYVYYNGAPALDAAEGVQIGRAMLNADYLGAVLN